MTGGMTTCTTLPYGVGYTSTWRAGAAAAPVRAPPGPCIKIGVVPEQGPGMHMGIATSFAAFYSVALRCGHVGWLVYCPGVSSAGHAPPKRLVRL